MGRAARIRSFSNFDETLHPVIFQIPLFAKFTESTRRLMQKRQERLWDQIGPDGSAPDPPVDDIWNPFFTTTRTPIATAIRGKINDFSRKSIEFNRKSIEVNGNL